ncbi:MAG: hypothetical protein JWR03_9, partial [Cohnella sp.]|nr:hypothetical protein [Cohnella sp.]
MKTAPMPHLPLRVAYTDPTAS